MSASGFVTGTFQDGRNTIEVKGSKNALPHSYLYFRVTTGVRLFGLSDSASVGKQLPIGNVIDGLFAGSAIEPKLPAGYVSGGPGIHGFNDRLPRTTQTYVVDQCSDPMVQDQVEWDFVDQPSKTVCADQGLLLPAGPANWQNPFHGQVQTQAIDKSFRPVASSFQTPTLWSMPQEFHAPIVTNSSMETLYSNVPADHQSAASYSWSIQPAPGFVTPLEESTSSFIVPSHTLVEFDTTSPIRIHQDSFDGSFESFGDKSVDYSSDGTSVSEEHLTEIKHESDHAIVKQDPDFGDVTRPARKIHTSRTGAKSVKKERRQPRSGRKKPKLGRSYISQKDGRTTVIEEYSAGRASNPERCSYVDPVTRVRCGSEFQRVEHLRRHEKIHFPEDKPFPCPLRECIDRKTGDHRRFPRTDNRFDHYKTHLREQGKGQRNTRVDFEIFCDLVRQAEEPDLADKTIERLRQWRSKERMKYARENGGMGFLRPKL
ncbi:hypothetical protein B0A49_03941 [Cryomyces minteri]|uniref:C2H2-type domain-containing protein n=1 Tax=Cryomyces minteri TaxID=331657 RepID=A0A4U0X9B7_9PEZI|nr:hypothetical protein B0A49_03941 [Cryomyces minteri]